MTEKPSGGWKKLALGAVAGAVAATVIGFGLSVMLWSWGFALVNAADGARLDMGQLFARAGLNFIAVHHVRIAGESMPGGSGMHHVSLVWPITLWAIVPAITLMLGGYISRKLSMVIERNRFAAGLWMAVAYSVMILIIRPFCTAPSVAIGLPQIEVGGWNPAPESIAVLLKPELGSTLASVLLFGIVFGTIGAVGGPLAVWKGIFRGDSYWPSWVRGSFLALLIGQIVFLLIAASVIIARTGSSSQDRQSESAPAAVTLLPTISGLADYTAHGITLRADQVSMPAIGEGFRGRMGLIRGMVWDGESERPPGWAYLAFLVPVAGLICGGYVAAKTANEPIKRPALAAGFAAAYALMLLALTPFFKLIQGSSIVVGGFTHKTAIIIGPSAAEAFAFGIVLAFVFGLIGVNIYRPYVNSQPNRS